MLIEKTDNKYFETKNNKVNNFHMKDRGQQFSWIKVFLGGFEVRTLPFGCKESTQ